MSHTGLPIRDAMSWGWETFKENAAFLIGIQLAALAVTGIVQLMSEVMTDEDDFTFLSFIMWLVYTLVSAVIELGFAKITLKYVDNETPEFANLFDSVNLVVIYLVAGLVACFAVLFGLVLLIVPGVILALRLQFISYVIVEEQPGPLDAVQRSWDITRGVVLDLFLFMLLLIAINLLGLIAMLVGLFISMPVSMLAIAYIYRYLRPRVPVGELEEPVPAGPVPTVAPE